MSRYGIIEDLFDRRHSINESIARSDSLFVELGDILDLKRNDPENDATKIRSILGDVLDVFDYSLRDGVPQRGVAYLKKSLKALVDSNLQDNYRRARDHYSDFTETMYMYYGEGYNDDVDALLLNLGVDPAEYGL